MSVDERVLDLLRRYEEHRSQGEAVTPEELCRESPDLLPEVQRRLHDLQAVGVLLLKTQPQAPPPTTRSATKAADDSAALPATSDLGAPQQAPPRLPPELQDHPRYAVLGLLGTGGVGVVNGKGNAISANSLNGIDTGNGTGNTIIGNYIGLGKDGSTIRGNSKNGIYLSSSSNTIGAAGTGPSNVISGNGFYGIQGFGATSNVVTGNYIGTDKTGNNARSNSQDGIYFDSNSSSNTIGGANAQAGNISSGNSWYGISMRGNSNVIQWNKFGIAANGTQLPNGSGGEDPIQGTGISWSHNSVQNGGSPLFLSLAETDSLDQSSIVSLGRSTLSPPIEGFFEGAEPVVSIADDSSLDGATNSPSPSRLGATSGFQRTGGILREPSSPWLIVTDLGVPVV